jgi:hypothetical protein
MSRGSGWNYCGVDDLSGFDALFGVWATSVVMDGHVGIFLHRQADDLGIAAHVAFVVYVETEVLGNELDGRLGIGPLVPNGGGDLSCAVQSDCPLAVCCHASSLPRLPFHPVSPGQSPVRQLGPLRERVPVPLDWGNPTFA